MNRIKLALILALSVVMPQAAVPPAAPKIVQASAKDINCLAQNIYHEARSESIAGQIAVAQVTVNRVKASNFTKNICKVVFEPHQFSWTNNKHLRVKDSQAWKASIIIAKAVLTNSIRMKDFTAQFYHTKAVNPRWNKNKTVLAVIGNHIFYA